MNDNDRGFAYYFTHNKTNKHVIATSWKEFFKLQSNQEYTQRVRLGITPP